MELLRPPGVSSAAEPQDLDFDSLLACIDFPRSQSQELARGRDVIVSSLRTAGVEARAIEFPCHTHRTDLAGAFCLLSALAFACMARRGSRWMVVVAASCALLALAAVAGVLDPCLPAESQSNVHCVVESRLPARQEIVLGAHYDTKTEPLDHVERTVGFAIAWVIAIVAGSRVWLRRGGIRTWSRLAAIACLACGAQWTAGRFLPPSHGIVDNGAAAMLLVEMAARTAANPLSQTRIVFAWWAGEEHGAQGSAAAARTPAGEVPRAVINLECIGAGPELGIPRFEWHGCRGYRADAALHDAARRAGRLRMLQVPVLTDAGSFLARGIPAITLVGLPRGRGVPRGLHRATDRIAALDPEGIAATRSMLDTLVRGLDDAVAHGALPPADAPRRAAVSCAGCLPPSDRVSCPPFVLLEFHPPAGELRCRARPSRSSTIAPAGATRSRS